MFIYSDRLSLTLCDYKYYITYGNTFKKHKTIELKEKCTPEWGGTNQETLVTKTYLKTTLISQGVVKPYVFILILVNICIKE